MTIEEYFVDYTQDIHARSGAEENFTRSIFLEQMCSLLEAEGLISDYGLTEHKITSRGQAVDVWSFDDERSCLTLIIGDFRSGKKLQSLTNTDIATSYKTLRNFLTASFKSTFAESLEESDPVTSLAWIIKELKSEIAKINLILVSNASLSQRVIELPKEKAEGINTAYEVWDFGRIFRNETSGKAKEDVTINFEEINGKGIPCLPAYTGESSLKSYLLVMPAQILADLYRDHGERLLEQNVRTFLQFRGKINKGIRNTIINEPSMFFSYNNGLSATAQEVETGGDDNRLLKVKNLQIVNGGQTTASIFTANKKEKADLSKVYVQIKLSVIKPESIEEVVPRISMYSNTQNRVNAADFFSNHPFHRRIEEFSRRLWAPSPEGGMQETHWFYERARGQYANKQVNLTVSDKRKFLTQNPRKQMFTKTDLAKFILSFEEAPHEVSLGAQKAFSGTPRTKGFVNRIAELWGNQKGGDFNEVWYKRAIAKAIFFKTLDRLVFRMPWYSGYKANIVTYTLAKFSRIVRESKLNIDFLGIWDKQQLPSAIEGFLGEIAMTVNEVLTNPPDGSTSNVSEWAKKEFCWDKMKEIPISLQHETKLLLIDDGQRKEREKEGVRTQLIQDSIHAQSYVVEKGAVYWEQLREWNRLNLKLSPKEQGILNVACSIPMRIPTDKQAVILIKGEERAKSEGFFPN